MTRRISLLAFIASSTLAVPAAAQNQPRPATVLWAEVGVGRGSLLDGATGVRAALRLRRNANLWTAYAMGMTASTGYFGPTPAEQTSSVGAMYGRVWIQPDPARRRQGAMASASLGLAYLHHVRRGAFLGSDPSWLDGGAYRRVDTHATAIPVEAQAGYFFGLVSVSLSAGIQLNATQSFGHGSLNLMVGRPSGM